MTADASSSCFIFTTPWYWIAFALLFGRCIDEPLFSLFDELVFEVFYRVLFSYLAAEISLSVISVPECSVKGYSCRITC